MSPPGMFDKAMGIANAAATLPGLRDAKQWPSVRRLRERLHWLQFLSDDGLATHYGVFDNFEKARAHLPSSPGFNQRVLGDEYVSTRLHHLYDYDRPVVAALRKAFASGTETVLDLGGSVGVHYHAYLPHIDYPPALRWTVYEVPTICELGREIASQEHRRAISFTETLSRHALAAELWLACGALHYMEDVHLGDLLESCRTPPRDVVLNKLPLYAGETFVSAQNIGHDTYVPHYVYNRDEFIAGVENAGYTLRHAWDVPERSFYLPDHPEHGFPSYSGLHFVRRVH